MFISLFPFGDVAGPSHAKEPQWRASLALLQSGALRRRGVLENKWMKTLVREPLAILHSCNSCNSSTFHCRQVKFGHGPEHHDGIYIYIYMCV